MRIILIGITLFALFFGAGNLIFPIMLGQLSGTNFGLASLGFVVTGVIMPLLGVMAMGFSGEKDFLKIAQRCGIIFGLIFATTLYLTIGPLSAMPRTGSVSYEIGLKPFVDEKYNTLCLALFTIGFYGFCCLLSLNPLKFIDIVGKILTPLKITFILILILSALIFPMGEALPPINRDYQNLPFFTGFSEGYLTMDTLASFIFGIIVVQGIINYGIKDKTKIMIACFKASLIAGSILAFFYASLVYMGATSVTTLGVLDNGGQVLAEVSVYYFGIWGNLILGLMVTVACMTTNIGLTHACANYLVSILPKFSYHQYVIIFSLISGMFANIGLSELILISKPVLKIIYPVTIVFIVLTFSHRCFNGYKQVYTGAIYLTLLASILFEINSVMLSVTKLSLYIPHVIDKIKYIDSLFAYYVPLYVQRLGWITPAFIGATLGYIYSKCIVRNK